MRTATTTVVVVARPHARAALLTALAVCATMMLAVRGLAVAQDPTRPADNAGAEGGPGSAATPGTTLPGTPGGFTPGEVPFAPRPEDRADPPLPADTEGTVENGDTVIHFYRCRHKDANVLKKYLDRLVKGLWSLPYGGRRGVNIRIDTAQPPTQQVVNSAAEVLVIEASRERLKRIRLLLDRLDVPRPQVLLDCRIIEVSYSRGFQLGFSFDLDRAGVANTFFQGFDLNYDPVAFLEALPENTPPDFQGIGLNFGNAWDPNGSSAKSFGISGLAIRALQQNGSARILANPRLLVEEDESARVQSGEDVFVQEITSPRPGLISIINRPRSAGITLDIRPLIISKDAVNLRLQPAVREITGFTSPGESGVSNPVIASRQADTLATVPSGKTLVIGGLIQTESRIDTKGIPLLADLPLIGELFKNHNRSYKRTEVIFAITPYIISEDRGTPFVPWGENTPIDSDR